MILLIIPRAEQYIWKTICSWYIIKTNIDVRMYNRQYDMLICTTKLISTWSNTQCVHTNLAYSEDRIILMLRLAFARLLWEQEPNVWLKLWIHILFLHALTRIHNDGRVRSIVNTSHRMLRNSPEWIDMRIFEPKAYVSLWSMNETRICWTPFQHLI